MASQSLASKLYWSIEKDTYGSDHFPIEIRLQSNSPKPLCRKRWLYKDADWAAFEQKILENFSSEEPLPIEQLGEKIIDAANSSIPKTTGVYRGKFQIWWTEEVQQRIKARRKSLRKLKKLSNNDPQLEAARKEFQEARSLARKAIYKAKKESWDSFCQSFNPNTPSDILWNNFHRLNGQRKTVQRGLTIDGKHVQDPTQIAEHFADYFYSTSSAKEHQSTEPTQPIPARVENSNLDSDFTLQGLSAP